MYKSLDNLITRFARWHHFRDQSKLNLISSLFGDSIIQTNDASLTLSMEPQFHTLSVESPFRTLFMESPFRTHSISCEKHTSSSVFGVSIMFPNNASRQAFKTLTKSHSKQTDIKLDLKTQITRQSTLKLFRCATGPLVQSAYFATVFSGTRDP